MFKDFWMDIENEIKSWPESARDAISGLKYNLDIQANLLKEIRKDRDRLENENVRLKRHKVRLKYKLKFLEHVNSPNAHLEEK